MGLTQTILAALSNKPCSGYDLSKQFAKSSGCFWKASQQQIYRELAELKRQKLIYSETVIQESRPNKNVYYVTKLGREKLIAWIGEPSEPTAIREDLLVKVLAASLVSSSVIVKELERRRQIHLQQLSVYKDIERERCQNFRKSSTVSIEDKCFCITLHRGIIYETNWISWCEEAICLLGI